MNDPIYSRISKVSISAGTITFPLNKAILEALRAAGEKATLSPDDGTITLEVGDARVLQKCADGLYQAVILKGGAATLVDNPHAARSFMLLKRGGGTFAQARATLRSQRTGPSAGNPSGQRPVPVTKAVGVIGEMHKRIESSRYSSQATRDGAARGARNLRLRNALTKCAGRNYSNEKEAREALTKALRQEGFDAAELREWGLY